MERLVQVHRPTMELLMKAILVLGALAAVVASGSPPTIYDEVDFDHGHDGSGVWERQQTSQTDLWVVQVGHGDGGGGLAGAEDVGRRLGLRVVGHIKGFPGHFLMERVSSVGPEAEDRPPARLTTRNLEAHGQVGFFALMLKKKPRPDIYVTLNRSPTVLHALQGRQGPANVPVDPGEEGRRSNGDEASQENGVIEPDGLPVGQEQLGRRRPAVLVVEVEGPDGRRPRGRPIGDHVQ